VGDTDARLLHDFTLMLAWKVSNGFLSVSTSKVSVKNAKTGDVGRTVITPAPARFWLVKNTDAKTLRPERIGKETEPGLLVAALPLMPTAKAIIDIMQGQRMHFAVGRSTSNKDGDRVLSFKAPLSKDASTSLMACLGAMLDSMYAHAAGTSCSVVAQVIYDDMPKARTGSCGARHECHTCQKGSGDKSLEAMINYDDRYAYTKGLNQLKSFIRNTQYDLSRRH
jgi:hypothetical protein